MGDKADKSLSLILKFLDYKYTEDENKIIKNELYKIHNILNDDINNKVESFEELQLILSTINENGSSRKKNGVYYTPIDLVNFIGVNSVKLYNDNLNPDNIGNSNLNIDINTQNLDQIFNTTILDPTSGTGEFLVAALKEKIKIYELRSKLVFVEDIHKILATIYGNDISSESTTINKFRLFLVVLEKYGINYIEGIANILNSNFYNEDFVKQNALNDQQFDIIIGNPPYIEDSKIDYLPNPKYGNVYANVLKNSSTLLKENGVMSFVIPLSYVSTPRMKKIRMDLNEVISEQYILSYSDRPDSLFISAHQKLCIIFFKKSDKPRKVFTGNYQYWYKDERSELFKETKIIENKFETEKYIPKLGNEIDVSVYSKISNNIISLFELLHGEGASLHLNMRAAFWMKAFSDEQTSKEYKEYIIDPEKKGFLISLLNSSIFWWFWICISDCWHITQKELKNFKVNLPEDFTVFDELLNNLEDRLEITKEYVGTKQTMYEYKHKECIDEINAIDDEINKLFGLTPDESEYIKKFALKYRTGNGVK